MTPPDERKDCLMNSHTAMLGLTFKSGSTTEKTLEENVNHQRERIRVFVFLRFPARLTKSGLAGAKLRLTQLAQPDFVTCKTKNPRRSVAN